MYDIIIVGAGPAGLTAALYALRSNKNVLIFESKSYGGKIVNADKVENYPGIDKISGFDFATNLYNQVVKFGGTIKYETVINISENKIVTTNKGSYKTKSVILATGSVNKKMNIENEERLIGKGVSYCAICDGNFFKDKVVAVIGGTKEALYDAKYLSAIAKKTYLISKEDLADEITDDNINVINNSIVTKILGDDVVSALELLTNNEVKTIDVDGIFIAIGHEPKNEIFKNIVDLDNKGYILSSDGVHTKTQGVYVAGDTRVKELRQLTTAVADGSIAATVAIKELD